MDGEGVCVVRVTRGGSVSVLQTLNRKNSPFLGKIGGDRLSGD